MIRKISALTVTALLLAVTSVQTSAQQLLSSHRAFLAITVADLNASLSWYDKFLGATRVGGSRAPSGIAEIVTVANADIVVELIHFSGNAPTDTSVITERAIGLKKAGVWVSSAVFDSTLARLRTLGATLVGGVFTDSALKARMFIVRDNSGTFIQYFTPLP